MNATISAVITDAVQPNKREAAASHTPCTWRLGVSFRDPTKDATPTPPPTTPRGDVTVAEEDDRGTRLGMMVNENRRSSTPNEPRPKSASAAAGQGSARASTPTARPQTPAAEEVNGVRQEPYQSLHEPSLFDDQAAQRVEPCLSASCEALGFDIAEMWLRTGSRSHQLIASYLRPTALDETQRHDLTELYYGVDASSRTHRFSPALCKKAKDVKHVIWVPDDTEHGTQALSCSLSNVKTAVAVPVTHQESNTNFTIIYFSLRRTMKTPQIIEFLLHMSLSTAMAAVNILNQDMRRLSEVVNHTIRLPFRLPPNQGERDPLSQSEHLIPEFTNHNRAHGPPVPDNTEPLFPKTISVTPPPTPPPAPQIDCHIDYNSLMNRDYLTDGTNNWIHTAVMNKRSVVVKELKPECEDDIRAINELDEELRIHTLLNHKNICRVLGGGLSNKGTRFIVLERLDGGMLGQEFGYKARIRDRRMRFARKKKKMSSMDALKCALAIAEAMDYCHRLAIPGCMLIHRDLKPDNIGFTLDGTVKVIDFGLSTVVENASPDSDQLYELSGETGSLRYMAPEVADARPYNHKVDVYSFGMIVWELLNYEKPFERMDRQQFYEQVVHGGERPPLSRRLPVSWAQLITQCWSSEAEQRPDFRSIAETLKDMVKVEQNKTPKSLFSMFTERNTSKSMNKRRPIGGKPLEERHSTWF